MLNWAEKNRDLILTMYAAGESVLAIARACGASKGQASGKLRLWIRDGLIPKRINPIIHREATEKPAPIRIRRPSKEKPAPIRIRRPSKAAILIPRQRVTLERIASHTEPLSFPAIWQLYRDTPESTTKDHIKKFLAQGYVSRDNGLISITDAGRAALAGPVEFRGIR